MNLGYRFVLCLSTTRYDYRRPAPNLTFLPLAPPLANAAGDPLRVVLSHGSNSSNRLTTRLCVVIDGAQSLPVQAFQTHHQGRLTAQEERAVTDQLRHYLGL